MALLLVLSFETDEDRQTFTYIYDRYKNLMLYKAYGILHDHMLAEDAVSEALLRIYKNLGKIEDPSSPKSVAFIITIVKNTALTLLRKKKRDAAEWYDDMQPESQSGTHTMEDQVIFSLSEQDIYRLVDRLGEEAKSVFLLKYAYDMSHKEIGRLLHMSENNVTVRLHRVRKQLADALKEGGLAHD